MKLAVLKETYPSERRVALAPTNVAQIKKTGWEIVVESGCGAAAGFSDDEYIQAGAECVASRDDLFQADVLCQVRTLGANPEAGRADLGRLRAGQIVIGMCDPLGAPQAIAEIAQTGAALFALEMIPRITRAQSMDVLSSMATIAGYRAVLLAATELTKMFPMLMTAAGTIKPARVFVIGAGVAGLQAIATAKRLGGVVQGYDVRPACREQVESLGGRFVELEAGNAEDKGGYAKAMDEAFYQRQRQLMAEIAAESDVIITTAAIPGRQSPLLITADAVHGMAAGSVIIDLAAERGGNCELSQADTRVEENGVIILGPTNLPAEIPADASRMFGNNVTKFLLNMSQDGEITLDLEDQIVRDTRVAFGGEVVNGRIREMLELPPLPEPAPEEEIAEGDKPIPFDDGSEDSDTENGGSETDQEPSKD